MLLAGEAGGGAVALEVIEVAADASHRGNRGLSFAGDVLGRFRLSEIGPFELGEIFSERQQVVTRSSVAAIGDINSFLRAPDWKSRSWRNM